MKIPEQIKESNDWWDYNPKESDSKIQWTHHCGGWGRARHTDNASWYYYQCGKAAHAFSSGEMIIQNQVKRQK